MYKRGKKNNGVTIVSLVILITILLIVSTTIVLNLDDRYSAEKLDKLASDLQILTEKTNIFYVKNKSYPISDVDTITINGEEINVHKLDLSKLQGLTLNYGKGNGEDYYVIDTSTGTVFYKKGIEGIYNLTQVQSVEGIKVVKITTQPEWKTVEKGENVTFSIEVDIEEESFLEYEWYKATTYEAEESSKLLDDGEKISGASTNKITINNLDAEDEGFYYCVVKYKEDEEITQKSDVVKLNVIENEISNEI